MANAGRTASKKTSGKKSAKRATRKVSSKNAVSQEVVDKIPPVQQTADNVSPQKIDPDYRRRMIAETSYYIAERHGFVNRSPVDDWLEAEMLVDHLINSGEAEHGTSVLSPK